MILKIPPRVAVHFPNAENSQEKHIGFFVYLYLLFLRVRLMNYIRIYL